MTHRSTPLVQVSATLGFLVALLFATTAVAQETTVRTVILDVQPDGTEELVREFGDVAGIEIKDQGWFVGELRSREMDGAKIMQRREDVAHLMSAANIDYIVAVQSSTAQWEVAFYDSTGEPVRELEFPRDADALSAADANRVRVEFERLLGGGTSDAEVERPDREPAPDVEAAERAVADESAAESRSTGERPGFVIEATGLGFKRDVTFTGANGAALNLQSALYPGGAVSLALYPKGLMLGATDLGLWIGASGGADSIESSDGDSLAILHLEAAGGVGLRTPSAAGWELRLGGAHYRFTLPVNDVFPSLTQTATIVGGRAVHELGRLSVMTSVDVFPFVFFGEGAPFFGERNIGYGFAARLDLRYALSERLGIAPGIRFRMLRSSFPGDGTLDFRDTRGFELVWGPGLSVTWGG